MGEYKNGIGDYSPHIWEAMFHQEIQDFCRTHDPISSLVRPGFSSDPSKWNWKNIEEVVPGTGQAAPVLRVGFERFLAPKLLARDKFLDVGCGPNNLTSTQGRYIYGIDPNFSEEVLCERGMKAIAEDLPFPDQTFDGVYADKTVGFYPHLIDYWTAVSEMLRVVKVDRVVIVRTGTGYGMDGILYAETEKRVAALGHASCFPEVSQYFSVVKKNDRWKV